MEATPEQTPPSGEEAVEPVQDHALVALENQMALLRGEQERLTEHLEQLIRWQEETRENLAANSLQRHQVTRGIRTLKEATDAQ